MNDLTLASHPFPLASHPFPLMSHVFRLASHRLRVEVVMAADRHRPGTVLLRITDVMPCAGPSGK